jgi:hypothetical protein
MKNIEIKAIEKEKQLSSDYILLQTKYQGTNRSAFVYKTQL